MKKNSLIIMLLLSVTLYGCSADRAGEGGTNEESAKLSMELTEINEEKQDSTDDATESQSTPEVHIPTKEEVLAMREQVLEGMSEEEIERLTENIKVANLQMESAYLNENIFENLEDAESPFWNYFDEKGDIQIGWTYDGEYQQMRDIMKTENISEEEFYAQYGMPETVYNRFDAENFIELLEDMKETVKNEKLQADLQQMIDETALAAETHDMEYAYHVYQFLHDMDYYLLRYGLEDVGKYVQDVSMLAKYYGVLSVYE